MEFLPTVTNNVPSWMNFIFMGVIALVILSLIVIAISALTPKSFTWLIEPVLIGGISFSLIFVLVSSFMYGLSSRSHEDNLQKNLSQKYDIVSVDYDSELAPLRITESESQLITINLKEGKKGEFLLTQDYKTNEPTLSELPESAVSLEEITR